MLGHRPVAQPVGHQKPHLFPGTGEGLVVRLEPSSVAQNREVGRVDAGPALPLPSKEIALAHPGLARQVRARPVAAHPHVAGPREAPAGEKPQTALVGTVATSHGLLGRISRTGAVRPQPRQESRAAGRRAVGAQPVGTFQKHQLAAVPVAVLDDIAVHRPGHLHQIDAVGCHVVPPGLKDRIRRRTALGVVQVEHALPHIADDGSVRAALGRRLNRRLSMLQKAAAARPDAGLLEAEDAWQLEHRRLLLGRILHPFPKRSREVRRAVGHDEPR